MTETNATPRADERVLQPIFPDGQAFKLIGAGGVGGIIASYLSLFLASLGTPSRLVLIDGDSFEPSNRSRTLFFGHGNKAGRVRDALIAHVADSPLALIAIDEYVTPENIGRLIREGDIVLAAVDNHATRKLLSDHCAGLDDVCLISGGNDGVGPDTSGRVRKGTFGNCQIAQRRNGRDVTPALSAYHDEIRSPADRLPTELSCTELAASVPQILFTNLMTASAILNTLWLHLCGELFYAELVFDLAAGVMRPLPLILPQHAAVAGREGA
jgi:hypothetical protein